MKVGVHLIPNRCMRGVGLSQKHWLRTGMNCSRTNAWTFSFEYGPVFILAQPSHPSNQKSWKIGLPATFAFADAASKSVSQGIAAIAPSPSRAGRAGRLPQWDARTGAAASASATGSERHFSPIRPEDGAHDVGDLSEGRVDAHGVDD